MSIYRQPKSKHFWFKFTWKGKLIRRSTKQGNKQKARQIEAKYRSTLASGDAGILEKKPAPTLAEFAEQDFLPYVRSTKGEKPNTVTFYENSVKNLKAYGKLADVPMDEITHDTIQAFIGYRQSQKQVRRGGKAPEISTVNRDLATLRRMFHLAGEWGKVWKALPKVRLLPGENRRERVLSTEEEAAYLKAATELGHSLEQDYSAALVGIRATRRGQQPRKPDAFLLRDVTTILIDCGLRPEECFRLRRENIRDGAVCVFRGKREASRRRIRMTERVSAIIGMRLSQVEGDGWLFPAETKSGHIEPSSLKKQHAKALKASGVSPFELYVLRHTCLTRWAKWMNPYILHRAAGHADMGTTLRYVHPSDADMDEAIVKAREETSGHTIGHTAQTEDLRETANLAAIN